MTGPSVRSRIAVSLNWIMAGMCSLYELVVQVPPMIPAASVGTAESSLLVVWLVSDRSDTKEGEIRRGLLCGRTCITHFVGVDNGIPTAPERTVSAAGRVWGVGVGCPIVAVLIAVNDAIATSCQAAVCAAVGVWLLGVKLSCIGELMVRLLISELVALYNRGAHGSVVHTVVALFIDHL